MKIKSVITPFIIFSACCISYISCSNNNEKIPPVNIMRFDREIVDFDKLNPHDRDIFTQKYSDVISILYPDTTISSLEKIKYSKVYEVFYGDVTKVFQNTDSLAISLGSIKRQLSQIFPQYVFPRIIGVITPYNQSIMLSDSSLCIGLNHYLGAGNKYYQSFDKYILFTKTPHQIPYNIAEAMIRDNLSYNNQNKTLLSEMLHEGIVAYIMSRTVGNAKEADILGFTNEQLQWCYDNQTRIWNIIIADDYLYSKSLLLHNKFINAAPFTEPISIESPGKLGRWIGLKIIESYVSKKDISNIAQLIEEVNKNNAQTILIDSQYAGK